LTDGYQPPHHMTEEWARRERRLREDHELIVREAADEPPHYPEPDDRPGPRAQWDEINGRWVEWDEDAERWTVIEDVHGGPQPSPAASDDGEGNGEPWLPGAGQSLDDIE
jgi:hypothetical protein